MALWWATPTQADARESADRLSGFEDGHLLWTAEIPFASSSPSIGEELVFLTARGEGAPIAKPEVTSTGAAGLTDLRRHPASLR